jgi:hypothetical protein
MENVFVYALLPTEEPPSVYVYSVNVTDTEDPVVFWLAKERGGVHETLFEVEKESESPKIQPEAPPQAYFSLCLKLDDFSTIVKVCAVPSVPSDTVRVLIRGMAVKVFEADAVTVPLLTPDVYEAEQESVFAPFEPCVIFTVLLNSRCVPLVVSLTLK